MQTAACRLHTSCMIPARALQPLQCYVRNHLGFALNVNQPALCRPFELPLPQQAQYITMASETEHAPGTPEWLQDRLAKLLKAPHISFPKPSGPLAHIRMGPGPIDLFSTYYNNFFTSDAKGIVAGKEVDREGLKQALLALQKKWHTDSAKFTPQASVENTDHSVSCLDIGVDRNSISHGVDRDDIFLDASELREGVRRSDGLSSVSPSLDTVTLKLRTSLQCSERGRYTANKFLGVGRGL